MLYRPDEYMNVAAAAAQWGAHVRVVQTWCLAGRIEGARRLGRTWLIPIRATRPADRREKPRSVANPPQVAELSPATSLDCLGLGGENLRAALPSGERQLLLSAELAKLRGDMVRSLDLAETIGRDSPWRAGALLCLFGVAGACGDADRVLAALRELEALNAAPGLAGPDRVRVETARAVAAVSLYVREGLPDWLVRGDFSQVPEDCRQLALYAWAKHLHGAGETRQMLGVALAALASARGGVATLYLELMAVVALVALNRRDEAREHAARAVRSAMPQAFLVPFAEHLTPAGGVIEEVFRSEWPDGFSRLMADHNALWRGWATTRNAVLRGRLHLGLTARERQVALLVTESHTNEEIAARLDISPTSVKQHVRNILIKLGVRRRREIARFVSWIPE